MPADRGPGTTASLQSGLTRWAGGNPARTPLIDVLRAITAAGARLAAVMAINPLKSALEATRPAPSGGPAAPTATATCSGSTPGTAANPSGNRSTALNAFAERLYVDALAGLDVAAMCSVETANPIAMLCEQAGGAATDGIEPILDQGPKDLQQRTPLIFGSRSKVNRVRTYLTNPHSPHERSPLFSSRGLFRT